MSTAAPHPSTIPDALDLPLDELRTKLVDAMLPHVPFDGWTNAAVDAALRDLGLPTSISTVAFPRGPAQMQSAFAAWTQQQLRAALQDGAALAGLKVRDKIRTLVRTRLESVLGPHKEAVRKGSHVLALPQNHALAMKLTWDSADDMWRLAGDVATDFNYYTKRATLSALLTSVSLYWLQDESEAHADAWAFLDRRIENIMQFEKTKADVAAQREKLPSLTRFFGRLRYPPQ